MPTGLIVYNVGGVVQIDENYKNPYCISTGTIRGTGGFSPVPVNLTSLGIDPATEVPVILIKPRAYGKWFGGCNIYRDSSDGNYYFMTYTSEVDIDYAIFSTQGVPIRDAPGNVGLQVFTAGGSIVFDSNYRHMRILSSQFRGAVNGYNYPMNISISGFSDMPWVISSSLIPSWRGLGSSESEPDPLGLFMKFNSNTSAVAELCYLARQENTAYYWRLASQGGQPNAVINTQNSINSQDPYFNRSMSVDFAAWA